MYSSIRQMTHIEIDYELEFKPSEDGINAYAVRSLILDACREMDAESPPTHSDDSFTYPVESCLQYDEWELLIECLQDRVLWDDDWEMEEDLIDAPPEVSSWRKHQFGIADDYFIDIVPDPPDNELEVIRQRLIDLAEEK